MWGSDQGFVGMNEWRIVADLFGSILLESLHNLPTISPYRCGWRVVATQPLSGKSGSLFRNSAISADDIWALGVSYPGNSSSSGTLLIEHWNGGRWSVIDTHLRAFTGGLVVQCSNLLSRTLSQKLRAVFLVPRDDDNKQHEHRYTEQERGDDEKPTPATRPCCHEDKR